MASKSNIRRNTSIFKHETESVMVDFAGDVIGYKVLALSEYKDANTVFVYADYNKEVKTDTIIKDALKCSKKVALPRVYSTVATDNENQGKYMKFHYISSMDDLEKGYNGIREPKEALPCADADTNDAIIIMPLVGFDADRNRVGYGGGFYDRYLSTHSFIKKIGIAYDEQKVDCVEDADEYDIKPDMIVTQKEIYC